MLCKLIAEGHQRIAHVDVLHDDVAALKLDFRTCEIPQPFYPSDARCSAVSRTTSFGRVNTAMSTLFDAT